MREEMGENYILLEGLKKIEDEKIYIKIAIERINDPQQKKFPLIIFLGRIRILK